MTQTQSVPEITRSTEITGLEFRDFYKNRWPAEFYIDDLWVDIEDERGNYILPDDQTYKLEQFGVACWQGPDGGTFGGRTFGRGEMIPIHELYAEVMGPTSKQVLVAFRIDPDKAEQLISAAKALGASHI